MDIKRKFGSRLVSVVIVFAFFLSATLEGVYARESGTTISFNLGDYEQSKIDGSTITTNFIPVPEQFKFYKNSPYYDQIDQSDSRYYSEDYIIGGTNANANEYPEYTLVLRVSGNIIVASCGGTLIARNKVLTAAHCATFPAGNYLVIPNFYSLNDEFVADDFLEISSVAMHPSYSTDPSNFDVAVMTLDKNASSPVASIHAGTNMFVGANSTVIGMGLTDTNPETLPDILQEVDVPIISNSDCDSIWNSLIGESIISPQMLCAGSDIDGRGACSGDSGGPLWTDINNQRVIVGTVSFGLKICENSRQNAVYARVGVLNSFLQSQSPETNFVTSNAEVEGNAGNVVPVLGLLLLDED